MNVSSLVISILNKVLNLSMQDLESVHQCSIISFQVWWSLCENICKKIKFEQDFFIKMVNFKIGNFFFRF